MYNVVLMLTCLLMKNNMWLIPAETLSFFKSYSCVNALKAASDSLRVSYMLAWLSLSIQVAVFYHKIPETAGETHLHAHTGSCTMSYAL